MKIESEQVYTFKLVTGEELIARVEESNDDHLVLTQPISVVISPQGLQMVPSLLSAKQTANVRLNRNSYSMVSEPREDVADSYRQATTGISVPPRKQIITG